MGRPFKEHAASVIMASPCFIAAQGLGGGERDRRKFYAKLLGKYMPQQ